MFDLDASKIVIVGVAALIFIPPKDLPRVMRQVGQFVGKMKRMANEFQGQFMDAMREADMADLRSEAQKLSDAARVDVGLGTVRDLDHQMRPLASQPSPPVSPQEAASPPASMPPSVSSPAARPPADDALLRNSSPAPSAAAEAQHTS